MGVMKKDADKFLLFEKNSLSTAFQRKGMQEEEEEEEKDAKISAPKLSLLR